MQFGRLVVVLVSWAPVALAQDVPMLRIPRLDSSPVIDGKADEALWERAAGGAGFVDIARGLPARAQTSFLIGHSEEAVYLFVRCHGEPLDSLVGEKADHDSSIWGGSLVEVFLGTTPGSGKYHHFGVNHAGTMADEYVEGGVKDLGVDPEWSAATGRDGEAWTAEIAIPFASLGVACPEAGAEWRANVCRNAGAVNELTAWAPVAGGFHQPEGFAEIVFAGNGPVAALENWLTRAAGRQALEVRGPAGAVAELAFPGADGGAQHALAPHFAPVGVTVPFGAKAATLRVVSAGGSDLLRHSTPLDIIDPWATIRSARGDLQRELELGELPPERVRELLGEIDSVARRLRGRQVSVTELEQAEADAQGIAAHVRDWRRLREYRSTQENSALPYFVTANSTMTKVQPETPEPGELADELYIPLARGEVEGTQLVVCPVEMDLSGVRVVISRLARDDGVHLARGQAGVQPVGFVDCKIQTSGAALTGRVPDVLLPDRAMDIAKGERQPFFVTIRTERDTPPGTYRGKVRVQPRNAPPTILPLTVRVYDVTLPTRSRMRTAFVLWAHYGTFMKEVSPETIESTYIEYAKVMLAYRISPIAMWVPGRAEDGAWDFSRLDDYLEATVPLGLTTVNVGGNGRITGTRDVEYTKAVMAHLRERGWERLAYFYGHDEASGDLAGKLQQDYRPLVAADPDVRIMQTGWSPHPDLQGLVRIWCPLTATMRPEPVHRAQEAGDEVWWYVCCGPTAPYANLFVDYAGIDPRILGWMTFQHGIEGLLYWGVDVWPGNTDTLEAYDRANYATWNPNSYGSCNGDGYLLYPGVGDRPVPSFRLAALRDGIEDYDLFCVLRELAAQGRPPEQSGAERLLDFGDLIPSLTEYTDDPEDLLDRREAVLKLAEKLQAGDAATKPRAD